MRRQENLKISLNIEKKSRNPKRIQQTYVLKRGDTVEDPAGGTIDRHSVKSKFEEKRIG